MTLCTRCNKPISQTEIALTLKLINRGTKDYQCFDCLGALFHATRSQLEDMADGFRAAGCTLFPPKDE